MRRKTTVVFYFFVVLMGPSVGYAESFDETVNIVESRSSISEHLDHIVLSNRNFETTPQGYEIHYLFRLAPGPFDIGCSAFTGQLALRHIGDVWRPAMNGYEEWISCNLSFKDVKLEPYGDFPIKVEEIKRMIPIDGSGETKHKKNCTKTPLPEESVEMKLKVVSTERETRKLVIKRGSTMTSSSKLSLALPIGNLKFGGDKKIDEVTVFSSEEMTESFSEKVETKEETRTFTIPAVPPMTRRSLTVKNMITRYGIFFSGVFKADAALIVEAKQAFGLAGVSKRYAIPPQQFTGGSISDIRQPGDRLARISGVMWLGFWNDEDTVIKDVPVTPEDCEGAMGWPALGTSGGVVMGTLESTSIGADDGSQNSTNMDVVPVTDLNAIGDCLKSFDEYLVEKTGVLYVKASIRCAGSLAYITYEDKIRDSG